jgi:hypothetical protein
LVSTSKAEDKMDGVRVLELVRKKKQPITSAKYP